jgi:pimeloyl-ACP methyl ester carboxylesterase
MRAPNPRYRVDRLPAESLRDNPIGSPAVRELAVYLPPGYHERPGQRYPVIYFLHGYGLDSRYLTVGSRSQAKRGVPLALRLLYRGILKRLLWYETLDGMIRRGELAPFLLVQPDGSLHLPHRHGFRRLDGSTVTKGSLYTDSPYTGRFRTYILEEVIAAVDARYRTLPRREGRALMGGSMGGYGALLGGILHPERFGAVVALSPSICCLDLLDLTLVTPYQRLLLGERKARERGRSDLDDILDTCDLVYSRDRPLLPTIERDGDGKAARMDPAARENWAASDLNRRVKQAPDAFRGVRLLVNCEASDEFGFAGGSRRFHDTLWRHGIEHEFEIYSDPLAARYSPHIFGIAWRILPGIRFCLAPAGG